MSVITSMPSETEGLLASAAALGFDRLVYGIDVLDGEIDAPEELLEAGFQSEFLMSYIGRLRQDPLRRMVARGEIHVGNMPIVVENHGTWLSIAPERRLSVGDINHLRWMRSNGLRTGVSFRVRLPHGREASLNFFSNLSHPESEVQGVVERLFVLGHRVHAQLEPRLRKRRSRLLSSREAECLEWIAMGKSNREIALLLGLSSDTVKEHVQSLFQKLQVSGRAQAVARGHALAYLS